MKIWRYMDLAKFISLISTKSLYFACTNEFEDKFEGWLPRSHIEVFNSVIIGRHMSIMNQLVSAIEKRGLSNPETKHSLDELEKISSDIAKQTLDIRATFKQANEKFGINCWHANQHESAAMWKLYSTGSQAVAIVSTENRLKNSLSSQKNVNIGRVRYEDFDRAKIKIGYKHYGLFIKRKSFSHENELRATILLENPGNGALIPCELETLIDKIYISPLAPIFYVNSVKYILENSGLKRKPKIIVSNLLDDPEY